MMLRLLAIFFGLITLFYACRKEIDVFRPTPYALKIPSHFPQMPVPIDNPMTMEGVALGRKLFHDKKLSGNNTMACATCHMPSSAFAEPTRYSTGISGAVGDKNAMALINLGWQKNFFWDGRTLTLEELILEPVSNPIEMHLAWSEAELRLNEDVAYKRLFLKAFGTPKISKELVAKAIAQFLRTMISGKSKFDVMYKWENNIPFEGGDQAIFQTISSTEFAGYDLFKSLNGADCFHCHNGPLMQVQKFSNNGLDATFSDLGRGKVTGNANDNGKFKVPTLRNIELSAPYMHDGRFANLDEVIGHYSFGVITSPTIDPLMEFANQGGVQLNSFERNLLKEFLLTLTDHSFINNPEFKAP
jgi:cytochrome c peroxidase